MAYKRTTRDEWEIRMATSYGWEVVNTEVTRKEAVRSIKEYRENQPGSYSLKKRRVKIEAEQGAA